jgi:hypothetical protein
MTDMLCCVYIVPVELLHRHGWGSFERPYSPLLGLLAQHVPWREALLCCTPCRWHEAGDKGLFNTARRALGRGASNNNSTQQQQLVMGI